MKTQQHDKGVKFYDINLTEDDDSLTHDSLIDLAVSLSGNDNEVNLSTENSQIEGVIVGFEGGKVAVRVEGEMRFKNGGLLRIPAGSRVVGARRRIGFEYFSGYVKEFVLQDEGRYGINAALKSRGTVISGGAASSDRHDVEADVLVRLPS